MIFITGGAFQGKKDFAAKELGISEKDIFFDMHEKIREFGNDYQYIIDIIEANGFKAVICDEIGCGVVPIDKSEREWREAVGMAANLLSKKCTQVWRVTMGIGLQLK